MTQSAEGYGGVKKSFYLNLKEILDTKKDEAVEHYDITENSSTQHIIESILKNSTSTSIEFVSTTTPTSFASDRLLFGAHSPVSLEIVDAQGRRVKLDTSGTVPKPVEDIPGSSYFELGGSKYIVVPAGQKYAVQLRGTGNGGLTFSLDTLRGESQSPTASVRVATVTPSTTVSVVYDTSILGNLSIDNNGDGEIDTILTPQGIDVTPKVSFATLRSSLQTLSLSNTRKLPLLLLVTTAETLDKNSKINPKLVPVKVLILNQLQSLLTTYQRKGWITQSELSRLTTIINKLK